MNVFELRQYTLHPGKRDVLIDLFERELLEPQEAVGAHIVGLFRDLDREDRFVWIRAFSDMNARGAALEAFYGGPVWKKHRDAANATMLDSDDVLLLRPATPSSGFVLRERRVVHATVCSFDRPIDAEILARFEGAPLACLITEPAENTFPRLPVRTGENVVVWFSSSDDGPAFCVTQRLRLAPTARSPLR